MDKVTEKQIIKIETPRGDATISMQKVADSLGRAKAEMDGELEGTPYWEASYNEGVATVMNGDSDFKMHMVNLFDAEYWIDKAESFSGDLDRAMYRGSEDYKHFLCFQHLWFDEGCIIIKNK